MADKEEVEPTAEASSAQLSDASETSADLKPQQSGPNGAKAAKDDASRNSQSEKVLEPAGVAAAASGAQDRASRSVTGVLRRAPPRQSAISRSSRSVRARSSLSGNRSASCGRSSTPPGSS